MKKRDGFAVLIAVAVLALAALPALAFHGEAVLEGAYEFVRSESPQGSSTTQMGMMVVKGDYMCHLRVSKEREKTVQDEADEERDRKYAAAFRGSNGTCGKIRIEGDKVIADWGVTLDPNDEGNTSEFVFHQDGGTLTIAPAGAPQFKFVYQRVE